MISLVVRAPVLKGERPSILPCFGGRSQIGYCRFRHRDSLNSSWKIMAIGSVYYLCVPIAENSEQPASIV